MTTITSGRRLVWSPRIPGILVSLFIGIFALDAFGRGTPIRPALRDFIVHLTPALVRLVIVGALFLWSWYHRTAAGQPE